MSAEPSGRAPGSGLTGPGGAGFPGVAGAEHASPDDAGTTAGFLVGLDIGGSHTRGALFHGNEPLRTARSGSANVQNVSRGAAHNALRCVLTELAAPPGTPVIPGAGRVASPHDAAVLADLLRSAGSLDPATPVRAVHDTRLILAAGGLTAGIALIAGTGSVAWGVDATGREARAGGWGYLLGDEGSGYWIGREAVRRVLAEAQRAGTSDVANGARTHGDLARAVLNHVGAETPTDLIAAFHEHPERTRWAGLARPVCELAERGDPAARVLVADAAAHLSGLVLTAAATLGQQLPTVVGGGLAGSMVGRGLAGFLEDRGITVTLLEREPMLGAPLLARTLLR